MAQKKKFYLVSTKVKNHEFEIVTLDKDTMTATVQGGTGVPFTVSVKQESLDQYGYAVDIRMVEVNDAPVHSEQATA